MPLEVASRPARGRLVARHRDQPHTGRRRKEHGGGRSVAGAPAHQHERRALHARAEPRARCSASKAARPAAVIRRSSRWTTSTCISPATSTRSRARTRCSSAMLDNHLQQGNPLGIDTRRITWPRTIDMNDRALRNAVIGLGGAANGVVARGAVGHHSGERGHGDRRARRRAARISRSARPDHRRRDGTARRGRRCARAICKADGRDGDAAEGRDSPESRADARGRPGDSCTPDPSATSRTAATAFSRHASASRSATSW